MSLHSDITNLIVDSRSVQPQVAFRFMLSMAILYKFETHDLATLSRLMKDPRVDVNESYNRGLRHACLSGQCDIIHLFLSDNRVLQSMNYSSIYEYCRRMDRRPVVQFLEQWRRRRVRGVLRASFLLLAIFHRTLKDRYAPGGAVAKELEREFYNK